jgi:hypothetical protein
MADLIEQIPIASEAGTLKGESLHFSSQRGAAIGFMAASLA